MIPWVILSPLSKQHHDQFSRFRTGDHRVFLYFTMGRPFPPKLLLHIGDLEPHLTHDFLGSSKPKTQTASLSVQPFLHRLPQSVPTYTLQWDALPLKTIAPYHGGIWTPSNTWFSGPTRVLNLNGISIGSAVFAGLTSVTADRPRYSVGNNRPHLST